MTRERWPFAGRGKRFVFFKIRDKLKRDNFVASSEVAMLERYWVNRLYFRSYIKLTHDEKVILALLGSVSLGTAQPHHS